MVMEAPSICALHKLGKARELSKARAEGAYLRLGSQASFRQSLRESVPGDGAAVERADVAIVGGGIVGSAVAYFLAVDRRWPGRVAIVERDTGYGDGSTARSAGGVRQQFSTPENIAMSLFTLATFRRLKTLFGADADVAFREQGYLILASADGETVLAENVALQRSMGADVALLSATELTARFAWLSTEGVAAGGFGQSGEGWFDPPSLAAL